jgi:hypothetical protein
MEHKICHFEIPAEDVEKIKDFYQKLFGWEIKKDEHMEYFLIKTGEGVGGGIMKKENPQQKPINYILVESVDEHAKKVQELGGRIMMEKQEIPSVGFHAIASDPEGNVFGIFEENRSEGSEEGEETKKAETERTEESEPESDAVSEEKKEAEIPEHQNTTSPGY